MAKLRIKNGNRRGLDISDAERLKMLEAVRAKIDRAAATVPRPRKCKRPSCRKIYSPHVFAPHQRYCSYACRNAEAQRRLRDRYKLLRLHLENEIDGRADGKERKRVQRRINKSLDRKPKKKSNARASPVRQVVAQVPQAQVPQAANQ